MDNPLCQVFIESFYILRRRPVLWLLAIPGVLAAQAPALLAHGNLLVAQVFSLALWPVLLLGLAGQVWLVRCEACRMPTPCGGLLRFSRERQRPLLLAHLLTVAGGWLALLLPGLLSWAAHGLLRLDGSPLPLPLLNLLYVGNLVLGFLLSGLLALPRRAVLLEGLGAFAGARRSLWLGLRYAPYLVLVTILFWLLRLLPVCVLGMLAVIHGSAGAGLAGSAPGLPALSAALNAVQAQPLATILNMLGQLAIEPFSSTVFTVMYLALAEDKALGRESPYPLPGHSPL